MSVHAYDVPDRFYADDGYALSVLCSCDYIYRSSSGDLALRIGYDIFYFTQDFFVSLIWTLEDPAMKAHILSKLSFPFVDLFK